MKYRMGNIWEPNKDISTSLILMTIEASERRRKETDNANDKHRWMIFTTYVSIMYIISLRGLEGFLLDLKSSRDMKGKATDEYIWLGLLGKLKG